MANNVSQTRTPGSLDTYTVAIALLFFASGMAGLVYQVAWSRLLTLVLGVSIFAITAVICTFMAGLALGSYLVGRYGEHWRNPLKSYGIIEGVIGLYALATPWLFDVLQPLYASMSGTLGSVGLNAFRIALSAAVLLLPTALMGGTLPLLARAVQRDSTSAAKDVGLLYAVNTFGAVAGCVLAGFVLLAKFGINGSLYITAFLNFLIAAIALLISRPAAPPQQASAEPAGASGAGVDGRLVLTVFFLTGFTALGYEILWTRALLVYLKSSTYAFSVMLAVYLFGVAAGSMLISGIVGRLSRPLLGVAICQIGVVVAIATGMLAFPNIHGLGLKLVGSTNVDSFARAISLMFTQASIVLLVPTLFMGAAFPFGVAAYQSLSRGIGQTVGGLYAANTAGNIAGSILVGFVSIPTIGVRHSMMLMIAINLSVAAAIAARYSSRPPLRLLWPAGALVALAVMHFSLSDQTFYRSIYRWEGAEILYYREGASDTVAVVEQGPAEKRERVLIYSDGRGAAGTTTLAWNLYFGHLPMLLHEAPNEILHICYGSGNSVLALTRHNPERIDVVELSPHVSDASDFFWTNEGVIHDPRVNLIIEDGRNYLLGTDHSYDVISLEPPNIFTAGVVNLYTVEFYELVKRRMNPHGIFLQWLPTAQLSEQDRGHMIRAFTDAFPHVNIWQELIGPTILLVGTLEPLELDLDEMNRRLASEALKSDVEVMRTPTAESFLSYYLLGDESTRRLVNQLEPVVDDRTIVDYSIPRFLGSGFGFSLYTYAIGTDSNSPFEITQTRSREYAHWGDPASLIVPDAAQARRLDAAIANRMKRSQRRTAAGTQPAH